MSDSRLRELERRALTGGPEDDEAYRRERERVDPCPIRKRLEAFLRSPLARFTAWKAPDGTCPQGDFVKAAGKHRVRVARWGNRCGKSEIGAVDTIMAALGWHPNFPHRPPLKIWISALDWNMIGAVIWPKIKRWLPPREIADISWLRRSPPIPLAVRLHNGTTIDFKSADSGRRKYQGAQCDLIWLDEEHPADVVEEVQARLLDTGGHLTVTATPIMRARWLQDLERLEATFVNRANTIDAARAGVIDLEATLAYAEQLPERQRRVRIFGDLVQLEGAVYPAFSPSTHVARPRGGKLWIGDREICEWPLPSSWPRYGAVDFGYHVPTAVIRAAHDGLLGRLIVERCWHTTHVRASRWAEHLAGELAGMAAPLICDRSADGRAEFEAQGIATVGRPGWEQGSPTPGLELVERLMEPGTDGIPKLILVEDPDLRHPQLGRCDAKKLAWELEHYHYPQYDPERPSRPDLPVKQDDHGCDALRYLAVYVVELCRAPVDGGGFGRRLAVGW